MSAFGDLAYPADFPHFKYVNPAAPRGGVYSEAVSSRGYNGSFLTFNSLNAYILKGEGAFGMDYAFATLMVRSGDEPDAMYGLAAKSVRISEDGLTYRFTLREPTKFHDGTPLTAHDVAWSLNALKEKGHPIITQQLRDYKGTEAADDRTVVVRFAENRARDVRCSSPGCRSSPRPITPSSRSISQLWSPRSAAAPTKSAASTRGISSNSRA